MWSLITGYNMSLCSWFSWHLSHWLLSPHFLSQFQSLQFLTEYSNTLLGSRKAQSHCWREGGVLWSFCILKTPHSWSNWLTVCSLPRGGSGSCTRGAPTLLELGSPVSNVSLQSWHNATKSKWISPPVSYNHEKTKWNRSSLASFPFKLKNIFVKLAF
jgi:hypothetical protein